MTGRRQDLVPLGLTVAAVAAVALMAPSLEVPAFLPLGDYAPYDANSPRVLPLLEPVVHAPWLGTPAGALAACFAAVFGAAFWTASVRAGATTAATAIALLAFMSRPDLREMVAAGAPAIAAIVSVWAAYAIGAAPIRGRLVTGVSAAGACALWPPALVLLPTLAAWQTGAAATLAVLFGGAVGTVIGVWRWTALAAAMSGESVVPGDVWQLLTATDMRAAHAYVWPAMSAMRLPVALMAVGLVSAAGGRGDSLRRAAGLVVTFGAVAMAPPAWRDEVVRAVYWLAWPAASLGISWLAARASRSGQPLVLAAVGLVLVGAGVSSSLREIETLEPRAFAAALARAVGQSGEVTYVAEDRRVDTALVALRGPRLRRIRPAPALIEARRAAGERVFAGSAGRAALELWGFRAEPRTSIATPVPYAFAEIVGRYRCVPVATAWRELPGLEYSGRLGVHLPAGRGRFEAVVLTPHGQPRLSALGGGARGRVVRRPIDLHALPPVLWPDRQAPIDPSLSAFDVALDAVEQSATATSLALGSRAPAVAVRFTDDASTADVAMVCAAPLPRDDGLAHAPEWIVPLDDPTFFAAGWHLVEGARSALFRWTTGDATLLLPSSAARDVVVAIDARPAVGADTPPTVTASVNGWTAGVHVMRGTGPYSWTVPRAVWVDGANEVRFQVSLTDRPSDHGSHDARELGMMVTAIRVTAKDNAAGK